MMQFVARGPIVLFLAITLAAAPENSTASGITEYAFLDLLKEERVAAGRAPLVMHPAMHQLARTWSNHQAANQRIEHRSMSNQISWIESQVTAKWQRIGEKVGYGNSVRSLNQTLMTSADHRANVIGDFTHVGIGSVRDGAGRLWFTFNFLKAIALRGPDSTRGTVLVGESGGRGRNPAVRNTPCASRDPGEQHQR